MNKGERAAGWVSGQSSFAVEVNPRTQDEVSYVVIPIRSRKTGQVARLRVQFYNPVRARLRTAKPSPTLTD